MVDERCGLSRQRYELRRMGVCRIMFTHCSKWATCRWQNRGDLKEYHRAEANKLLKRADNSGEGLFRHVHADAQHKVETPALH